MAKLSETLKVVQAVVPASYDAGTTYNGVSDASGIGIDTEGFDEALIVVNSGTTATNGTLDITVRTDTVNTANASASDAVTSATFTQITPSNDNTVYVGNIRCKDHGRYLFIKAVGATAASVYGVSVILSKADSVPVTQVNTTVFSV